MRTKPETLRPLVSAEAQAFYEAGQQGDLLLRTCLDCGALHHYPRGHCPACGSRNLDWRKSAGQGRVYSFTVMSGGRRAVAPAIIDLEDGLRINSVVLDADVHRLEIGDPVQVRFQPDPDGAPRLAFTTPAAEAARAYSAGAFAAVDADRQGFAAEQAPIDIRTVAVIGAGNMGIGIATAFLKAGFLVLMLDQNGAAFDRARARIAETFDRDIQRKRIDRAQADTFLAALTVSTDMAQVAEADLVVEAVWEDLALKKEVFALIDGLARPGVCLCSNTSTLDIDEIAAATRRPDRVVGLHFFNPAHVMKLLEVVRGAKTSAQTLAMATQVGMRLGKVPVVVGNAHGFVGNRLMIAREREAARLLLEGALPDQVDAVLTRFGMPMGTFEMQDMAGGIELSYRARQAAGEKSPVIDRLFEAGRLGQKTGKGYYRYEQGRKRPIVDPEVTAIIEEASAAEGITRRSIADAEIEDRLILPMVNEGAKLIETGIARRASDIDVVWQTGFGWPEWKGGPMYHADQLGIAHVAARLAELEAAFGERFAPAALLVTMASAGAEFTNDGEAA
ncbi:3-hydroxyacyl-CoA dehydrogenase NAD-binding domain-containing protein [uncultured Roseibium sp.]|uniref:3-hydroxyacyl-CoA dehydrogenase NAD-binding domain-containing protein n=1 Tax=uncultured Roseibium sp. TaxID=1936171 RepID=UPI003216BDD1